MAAPSRTIDTHIHLTDFSAKELKNIIDAREKVIAVSTSESDWEKLSALCEQFPNKIIPAFGLHPWYVKGAGKDWQTKLENLIEKHPGAVIGEIGLDGLKDKEEEPQASAFEAQIELAKEYNRPVLIHAVKCWDWLEGFWKILPQKFVFHSYNGKRELLKKIIAHGGYVSFSPSILKEGKEDIISLVPNNRILVETDAPYQGKAEDLEKVIGKITKIKNIEAEYIYNNTLEFLS